MAAHVLLGNPDGVAPDSMAARVILGNSDGVALDSNARSVSSGGEVPTPCTRRRSPLRRANISLLEFFPGQTCPDLLIALTRRASTTDNLDSPDSHFCTVQRNFS